MPKYPTIDKSKKKDVILIGHKKYDLSNLTKNKLQHLLQLSQIEIDNYEKVIINYPEDRMEKYGKPFLKKLIDINNYIQSKIDLLNSKEHHKG